MSQESILAELLLRWEELTAQGQEPAPEELCRNYPELATDLDRRIQVLRRWNAAREALDQQTTVKEVGTVPDADAGQVLPQVPGYEVLGMLGRGGMGVVYQARQLSLQRLVALKMIRAGAQAGPDELTRFRAEALSVAHLRHPNVVQIYEVGERDGLPFFSLEYVEGGSLARKTAGTPQPARTAAETVATLAQAVQHAHQHGIVHRDLKPANVLLTADGVVKVTDFGLAKQLAADSGQTQSGTVVGTPSYMAPEQAQGKSKDIGPACDVYSLGAILYELLTGRPPFRAETPLETVRQVIAEEPVRPRHLHPKVPRDLETICLKCLRKEPGRRYGSAAALAEDLGRFLVGKPIQARPANLGERGVKWARRRPAVAALLALTVLVSTAAFAVVTWHWRAAVAAQGQAEQSQRAEAAQRRQADAARQKEEAQKREFQRLSTLLLLDKGQKHCEEDDAGRGLLWLARALQVAPASDADLQRVLRANLADWQRQFYPLRAVFSQRGRLMAVALSPDGKMVLTGGDDKTARLWDAATGAALGQPMPHKDIVRAVAFRPDGRVVATGSNDKTVRLWDAKGQPLGEPLRHARAVLAVAFSPDGKTLLTAGTDRTARLWDATTGQPQGEPLRHEGEVWVIAFSPDGKRVLTGSHDKTARLWDSATGKPLSAPLPHGNVVLAAAFSPTGKLFATASQDMTARLWDPASGKPHGEPLRHEGAVMALAFHPDGATLITGSTDHTARLWDVPSTKEIGSLKLGSRVQAVAFSPDGETLLTGGHDQTARLWARSPREPRGLPLPHQSEVEAAFFGPEGKTVLTATREKTARLWDVTAGKPFIPGLVGHEAECPAVAFSPDGTLVLTGSYDKTARLWDAGTGKPFGGPLRHQDWVTAVAFSPDGKLVLTGSKDRTARLWDVATGKPIGPPLPHKGAVRTVAFSPDGKAALTTSSDERAQLWETATGTPLGQPLPPKGGLLAAAFSWIGQAPAGGVALRHVGGILAAAFSPDGKTVVTGSKDKTARFWDATIGQAVGPTLTHDDFVYAVAFSPDGQLVLTGSRDETARLWDAASGQPRGEALKHQGEVRAVAFSSDGETILTAGDDRTARLWCARTGQPLCPPLTHHRGVSAAVFSPDGKTVLTGCRDGTARFWDVETGKPLGMPLKHPFREVLGVAFSPDGKRAVIGSGHLSTHLWDVPVPVVGDAERLGLWVQVLTGLELDADGAVGALDATRWQERRKRLEELGGPPLP